MQSCTYCRACLKVFTDCFELAGLRLTIVCPMSIYLKRRIGVCAMSGLSPMVSRSWSVPTDIFAIGLCQSPAAISGPGARRRFRPFSTLEIRRLSGRLR
jgi:hypothetical protein